MRWALGHVQGLWFHRQARLVSEQLSLTHVACFHVCVTENVEGGDFVKN